MPAALLQDIRLHLFGNGTDREQGGFLLCSSRLEEHELVFEALKWLPSRPEDYVVHDIDYLELRDDARARLIKHAHDEQASIVELHSHPSPRAAAFSPFDLSGLAEFVPHVRWRLKQRPYGALVFGFHTFDGLAWISNAKAAVALRTISTESTSHGATGLSMKIYGEIKHA